MCGFYCFNLLNFLWNCEQNRRFGNEKFSTNGWREAYAISSRELKYINYIQ